jgi:thioredoxin-related protein
MNIPSLLFTLSLGLLAVAPTIASQTDSPFLPLKSQDAFARAETEGLPVLIWFSDPELPMCRRMKRIFHEEHLFNWIKKNTICIQAHPREEPKLAARYGAQAPPCSLLIGSNRQLIERLDGVVNADKFLSTFELALTGLIAAALPEGESATDPYAWLAWANHLFTQGTKPEDCLEAYMWVLDNADKTHPGLRARSLEFLLKRVAFLKLGTDLATPRLLQRRADLQRSILAGDAGENEIFELTRFNFWLRQEVATTQFFAQLSSDSPAHRAIQQTLILHDLEQIVAWRHYAAVRELVPEPTQEVLKRLADLKTSQEDLEESPPLLTYGLTDTRSRVVADAAHHYEVLLASGLGAQAKQLLEAIASRINTGRVYVAFMTKSNRLELYALSTSTGEAGLEVLGPKGQRMVRTALMRTENLAKGPLEPPKKSDQDGDR